MDSLQGRMLCSVSEGFFFVEKLCKNNHYLGKSGLFLFQDDQFFNIAFRSRLRTADVCAAHLNPV